MIKDHHSLGQLESGHSESSICPQRYEATKILLHHIHTGLDIPGYKGEKVSSFGKKSESETIAIDILTDSEMDQGLRRG